MNPETPSSNEPGDVGRRVAEGDERTAISPGPPSASAAGAGGSGGPSFEERYRIVRMLGRGGFGTVFLAHDRTLDQDVAIKVMKTTGASETELRRFLFEARTSARLRHPAIVNVFDIVQESDRLHLIMEYYPGGSVSQLLKEKGAMSALDALAIARQVALGLGHAHKKGIVHRDIKPANLFLAGEGVVKLGDFGIAAHTETHEHTMTGEVMGSPLYMSPEQTRDSKNVDGRSDIYSLGLTIFHMLTGQPPRVLDLERIDPIVRPLLKACIDEDPDRRPANCEEFVALVDQTIGELHRAGRGAEAGSVFPGGLHGSLPLTGSLPKGGMPTGTGLTTGSAPTVSAWAHALPSQSLPAGAGGRPGAPVGSDVSIGSEDVTYTAPAPGAPMGPTAPPARTASHRAINALVLLFAAFALFVGAALFAMFRTLRQVAPAAGTVVAAAGPAVGGAAPPEASSDPEGGVASPETPPAGGSETGAGGDPGGAPVRPLAGRAIREGMREELREEVREGILARGGSERLAERIAENLPLERRGPHGLPPPLGAPRNPFEGEPGPGSSPQPETDPTPRDAPAPAPVDPGGAPMDSGPESSPAPVETPASAEASLDDAGRRLLARAGDPGRRAAEAGARALEKWLENPDQTLLLAGAVDSYESAVKHDPANPDFLLGLAGAAEKAAKAFAEIGARERAREYAARAARAYEKAKSLLPEADDPRAARASEGAARIARFGAGEKAGG